jgi:hypothetical protein
VNKKQTIGVVVTDEMRNRVKHVAKLKHWSLSQTIALFMETHWDEWERELGIVEEPAPTPTTKKKKSVP